MSCERVREALSDLFDGRFPEGDPMRAGLEAHLEGCPACASVLADYGRIRRAVSPVGARLPDPAAFDRRLEDRLGRTAPRRRLRAWIPLAAAAGVALAVSLLRTGRPPEPVPAAPPPPAAAPVPASWRLVGETGPSTVAELREARDLEDLLEEVRLVRGPRRDPGRAALFREMATVRDLAVEEVAYAP